MASLGDTSNTSNESSTYDSHVHNDLVPRGGHTVFNDYKPVPQGRVVGVYYDKQRRIWRANWREGDVGKRKTKNFSVDDYGFEEARRLAIEYRLMKITEIAQMEFNCPEIDRIRLSTCRAPAQPTNGERSRKRLQIDPTKKRARNPKGPPMEGDMFSGFIGSGAVNPPGGEFYDVNEGNGMYWGSYPNQYYGDPMQMWYYNPDLLYSLYQQNGMTQEDDLGGPLGNTSIAPPMGLENHVYHDYLDSDLPPPKIDSTPTTNDAA